MSDYFDLGPYRRSVSTESDDSQRWFDRGLNWTYGYNQDEAIRCFMRAIEADPECAMAHWGLAYAHGPYLNKEWRFYADDELDETLPVMYAGAQRALALASDAPPVEHAMCEALTARYPSPDAAELGVMEGWNHDFADAMVGVYERFPVDRDVIAICAEALMMRTPWKLWDLDTGEPAQGAATLQILDTLQSAFALEESQSLGTHPGVAHMMCHTVEMSQTPERGLPAADALRAFAPSNAHLLHMPGHIDVLRGNYHDAVVTSAHAIAADHAYLAEVGPFGQYTAAICHDNHLMMFASMLLGRWGTAIEAADTIGSIVTDEVLVRSTPSFQITLEAYVSMRMHVFVRFGKWAEILDQEPPREQDLYPVTTAMDHYARAIAHASLGREGAARAEIKRFDGAFEGISPDRHLFNNTSLTVLAVAREMMEGEVAYHRGDHKTGFDHLRRAVRLNDELNYTEPWAWMHPPRHALGALLLARDHVEEAEAVYRADLGLDDGVRRPLVHPDNVWSLHGYVECLQRLGKTDILAAWRAKLDVAVGRAGVTITSSCACRLDAGHADEGCGDDCH